MNVHWKRGCHVCKITAGHCSGLNSSAQNRSKVSECSLMHVQPFVVFADDFKTPKPPCGP